MTKHQQNVIIRLRVTAKPTDHNDIIPKLWSCHSNVTAYRYDERQRNQTYGVISTQSHWLIVDYNLYRWTNILTSSDRRWLNYPRPSNTMTKVRSYCISPEGRRPRTLICCVKRIISYDCLIKAKTSQHNNIRFVRINHLPGTKVLVYVRIKC